VYERTDIAKLRNGTGLLTKGTSLLRHEQQPWLSANAIDSNWGDRGVTPAEILID